MKIGILIDRLNVGGVEKIAIEEVRALRQKKVDAVLLILNRKSVVKNAFPDLLKGLPIIYLDDRLPSLFRFSFKFPVFYFFSFFHISYPFLIPFVIKKDEFDYIISHSTYTSFTAVGVKKIRHIHFSAFIWDPIGYILKRVYSQKFPGFLQKILGNISTLLDKMIVINADAMLVGGDAHNAYFKSLKKNVKIVTIPPSVHPIKKIVQNKKPYIFIATAWKPGKNPEYLTELIKAIPTLHIKMAGKWLDEEYRRSFDAFLKKERLEKSIEVLGPVSEAQMRKLYAEATIAIQTNDDRGFGMPALEAAGNGTTFIIPEGQGVCNLFKEKVDGFYTKEKDTETIVKYLKLLLDDETLNKKMSQHAWGTVKKNYSWDKHADQILSVVNRYAKK